MERGSLEKRVGKETEPHLKHRLASHALALAQLAEKIEREEAVTERDEAAV
jgi:hypothetical protein